MSKNKTLFLPNILTVKSLGFTVEMIYDENMTFAGYLWMPI